jgi:hypothetical protein
LIFLDIRNFGNIFSLAPIWDLCHLCTFGDLCNLGVLGTFGELGDLCNLCILGTFGDLNISALSAILAIFLSRFVFVQLKSLKLPSSPF